MRKFAQNLHEITRYWVDHLNFGPLTAVWCKLGDYAYRGRWNASFITTPVAPAGVKENGESQTSTS